MILSVDIGNSSVKVGLFDGDALLRTARLAHGDVAKLHDFVGDAAIDAAGVSSVVPDVTSAILPHLRVLSSAETLLISSRLRLPYDMAYETPDTLGADRIAAVAGGMALYPAADPLITVDAGSAVTIEVVANRRFLGGAIAAGPMLIHRCLAEGTAELPSLTAELPSRAIGRSTQECMRIGVMVPFLEGLRRLIEGVRSEVEGDSTVIACGGWIAELADHIPEIDHVEPDLVLHGVRALVEANR